MLVKSKYRDHLLHAISSLQIICYSLRSRKSYTLAEHRYIFQSLAKKFFKSLSVLQHIKRLEKIQRTEKYNADKPPHKRRRVPHWTLISPDSNESEDTVSSSDENLPPYFLRSGKIIPHAFVHFTDQVRLGGTHNFHDTAHAEAKHPDCLKIAAARSRTFHDLNQSCESMFNFNLSIRQLEEICRQSKIELDDVQQSDTSDDSGEYDHDNDSRINHDNLLQRPAMVSFNADKVKLTYLLKEKGVGMSPLRHDRRQNRPVDAIIHHDVWDRVLSGGVPVSLRELVSLVAEQLLDSDTEANRLKLLQCCWDLGWHVTHSKSSGSTKHYWGGGVTPGTTSNYLRGDWVEVAGTDLCRGEMTSRLARIICGVKVSDLHKVFVAGELDESVWENDDCRMFGYTIYLLVRYASPHPNCGRLRGPEGRPLCPGHLKNTHCLWKWYERPANFRRGCWRDRPWGRHRHLFGNTLQAQNSRKLKEARAWYDLIKVSDITSYANISVDWDHPDSFLQSIMWC